VLFADIKGSMELAEELDAEEFSQIMSRFTACLSPSSPTLISKVCRCAGRAEKRQLRAVPKDLYAPFFARPAFRKESACSPSRDHCWPCVLR
jgi:hypothetical protein